MPTSNRRILGVHTRTFEQVTQCNWPQSHVEHLKLDLSRDTPKFVHLTAKLATECDDPEIKQIYPDCQKFFRRVGNLIAADTSASLIEARGLLSFEEPWENRLGLSANSPYGNGISDGAELGDLLFDRLRNDPHYINDVIEEPDALSLVALIGSDRISDIIASIGKIRNVRFTQQQAEFYQFPDSCMRVHTLPNIWDGDNGRWYAADFLLPTDDLGRPFTLTWKGMCRSGPPMNPGQFFRDLGPDIDLTGYSGNKKEQMAAYTRDNPNALSSFVADRMKDPDRFKARKDLRSPEQK